MDCCTSVRFDKRRAVLLVIGLYFLLLLLLVLLLSFFIFCRFCPGSSVKKESKSRSREKGIDYEEDDEDDSITGATQFHKAVLTPVAAPLSAMEF